MKITKTKKKKLEYFSCMIPSQSKLSSYIKNSYLLASKNLIAELIFLNLHGIVVGICILVFERKGLIKDDNKFLTFNPKKENNNKEDKKKRGRCRSRPRWQLVHTTRPLKLEVAVESGQDFVALFPCGPSSVSFPPKISMFFCSPSSLFIFLCFCRLIIIFLHILDWLKEFI